MASRDNTPRDAGYWCVPISRAVVAATLGIFITFSADHSPTLGLLAFGVFAGLSGLIIAGLSWRTLAAGIERTVFVLSGAVSLLAGIAALVWSQGGLSFLLFLITSWAALTGVLELYTGIRSRRRHAASRDWIFLGALTTAFSLVVLVIPPDLQQPFSGANGVSGVLSSSIVVVGALGAYGAIVAVYLVIAGLSLRWAPTTASQDGIAS